MTQKFVAFKIPYSDKSNDIQENTRHTILIRESDNPKATNQKDANPRIPQVHELRCLRSKAKCCLYLCQRQREQEDSPRNKAVSKQCIQSYHNEHFLQKIRRTREYKYEETRQKLKKGKRAKVGNSENGSKFGRVGNYGSQNNEETLLKK